MPASLRTIVVIDATSGSLPILARAVADLAPAEAAQIRVIARASSDLFDEKRIAAVADLVRGADALILLPHGGPESIPGADTLAAAAAGRLIHVQAGAMSPDEIEMARRLGTDVGSDAHALRSDYLSRGGAANLRGLMVTVARQTGAELLAPPPPETLPVEGIHHPQWTGGLRDRDGYLEWARARAASGAPVIGMWFANYSSVNGDLAVYDALIAEIEAQGGVPLAVFHNRFRDADLGNMSVAEVAETFFRKDGQTLIEVLLSPQSFSLAVGGPGSETVLPGLDVPVLQLIQTYSPRADWEDTLQAVSPMDVSTSVAQPEFDGVIIGTVVGTRDETGIDPATGARLLLRTPVPERCAHVVRWAMMWARLRRTPPAERKVAIIFHQYPPRNDRLGCASGLDSFESIKILLERMAQEGYRIDRSFDSGEAMAFEMLDRLTSDRRYLTPKQMAARAVGGITDATAARWHAERGPKMQAEMDAKWGPCPGVTFHHDGKLLVGGIVNRNVFLGVQPPRARMEEEDQPTLQPDGQQIHDPYLPATHHYLGYYRWLREEFGAHAVIHVGTHGTLEWLPGKSLGLSRECYPDTAISDIPHLYPYIINNPGEGTQAKRRSYCVILDHMIPPQTNAGKTETFQQIEDLLEAAYHARQEDPGKVAVIVDKLWGLTAQAHLDADIGMTRDAAEADPVAYMNKLHGYIETVDVTSINDGLHTLGQVPPAGRFNETMVHLTRLPNGDAGSLWDAVAAARGFDGEDLRDHPGDLVAALGKTKGQVLSQILTDCRAAFDALDATGWEDAAIAAEVESRFCGSPRVAEAMRFVRDGVRPKLHLITDEIDNTLHGLAGGFVPPGGSGSPTRGRIDILPTGRNFYSVDPFKIPTPEAWEVGVRQAEALVARYLADEGRVPRQVGIVLWGMPTMSTRGDDVAQILYMMGVRPVWDARSGRVRGLEVIAQTDRSWPRIDVTVRTSGFFRDAFPNLIETLDQAARMAGLDLTVKNEGTREYDIFSCTDFNAYQGSMNAAVKAVTGRYVRSYTGDSNDPRQPRIRATDEEGRFIFRTRVLNPKWIEGMKRHGYKGAGDLSRLVDIVYHWDASSGILDDWQYEELAKTYAFDPEMQAFFKRHNPYALQNIAERLLEAISRGLWENPGAAKDNLEALLLDVEGSVEDCLLEGMTMGATSDQQKPR